MRESPNDITKGTPSHTGGRQEGYGKHGCRHLQQSILALTLSEGSEKIHVLSQSKSWQIFICGTKKISSIFPCVHVCIAELDPKSQLPEEPGGAQGDAQDGHREEDGLVTS